MTFVLHSDGRISGVFEGTAFYGRWCWRDHLFCRTLDNSTEDCEVIEYSGRLMRYTRDLGQGRSEIVAIGAKAV
ncbi:MAG: hypothetical protein AAF408_19695 [Pseudomonadota bacterium]